MIRTPSDPFVPLASPVEHELARFIAQDKGAVRTGKEATELEPIVRSEFWRDYLGLTEARTMN